MDKNRLGLAAAISTLALGSVGAASAAPMQPQPIPAASSYADLLDPVPNAVERLAVVQSQAQTDRAQLIEVQYYEGQTVHHHNNYDNGRMAQHHHNNYYNGQVAHHHHNSYYNGQVAHHHNNYYRQHWRRRHHYNYNRHHHHHHHHHNSY